MSLTRVRISCSSLGIQSLLLPNKTSSPFITGGPMPKVRCENIIPAQQIQSAKNLLTAADCHLLRITKHPSNHVICHSLPEAIHLGLLESNFDVKQVVPQPFKLFIGTRRYIPDCYFEEKGRPVVVELKPKLSLIHI